MAYNTMRFNQLIPSTSIEILSDIASVQFFHFISELFIVEWIGDLVQMIDGFVEELFVDAKAPPFIPEMSP